MNVIISQQAAENPRFLKNNILGIRSYTSRLATENAPRQRVCLS
jgi:hypothetical protein